MNRRQKIVVSVTGIFLVLLLLVGLTYAYFLTRVTGNTNTKSISVKTANLALVYGDGNGILEVGDVVSPGDTVKFKTTGGATANSKTFTVTNDGNATTDYVVVIEDVNVTYTSTVTVNGETHTAGTETTFESNDFVYTLTCTSGCNGTENSVFPMNGGILVGNSIDVDEEQTYELTMMYKETGKDQSNDMNKTFTARVNIMDVSSLNPYSSNTSSLAYNIVNNAIVGKTGTTLAGTPLAEVANSISQYGTGKYELRTDISLSGLTYGNTMEEADNGENYVSGSTKVEMCNSVKEKYISDAYNCNDTCASIGYVSDCDSNGNPYVEVMENEKTLSVTQDDLGASYYYRGAVEDNYLEFNNMCWRIVRIEGDGAIKITLAAQKKCSEITSSDTGTAFIGTGHYGYNQGKVTNSLGQQSTSDKYVADYLTSPTNNATSMKYKLDEWYNTNLKSVEGKLKKDTWCLGNTKDAYDTSTNALLTSSVNDLMYNSKSFNYDTLRRLNGISDKYATLRCDGKNYESHESYIGALTVDEVVFAGGKVYITYQNYYLTDNATSSWWWTLSPARFDADMGNDDAFLVGESGLVGYGSVDFDESSLRPAVSLASSTVITGGNGTIGSPYIVG